MGTAREYFNRIVNSFGDIGYEAVGKVLNAADYGTYKRDKDVSLLQYEMMSWMMLV